MGAKLTKSQQAILREGNSFGGAIGESQRRRMCERLAARGRMERQGLRTFYTTDAGRAALRAAEQVKS